MRSSSFSRPANPEGRKCITYITKKDMLRAAEEEDGPFLYSGQRQERNGGQLKNRTAASAGRFLPP